MLLVNLVYVLNDLRFLVLGIDFKNLLVLGFNVCDGIIVMFSVFKVNIFFLLDVSILYLIKLFLIYFKNDLVFGVILVILFK